MKSTKNAASKKQLQQRRSPRSPLKIKDLNVSTSYSSSVSSSISNEAPRCCLRFLLSHHSSALSKNSTTKKPTDKTPPTAKLLKGKMSFNGDKFVKKNDNLQNSDKFSSQNAQRLKKKPPTPCFYSRKLSRKLSSRLDLSDAGSNVTITTTTQYGPTDLGSGEGSKKCGKMLCENGVNETKCGFELGEKDMDCGDKCSPIPPIQASKSPEIQGGSTSVVKATPNTCYGAGHVLSGISDKRKCRPRGLLTFGDNDLFGSSKTKMFRSDDEDVIGGSNKPRMSLVPCPVEASMHWILSPCDERRSIDKNDDDDYGKSEVRLDEYKISMPLKSIGCSSSPSSSLGFSSELSSKSNSAITVSDATTVSHGSRSRSSEFQGVVWPSFDHLVRSPSPWSPDNVPSSMVEFPLEHEKHQENETTPCSFDSIGSKNVIQTPQSNTCSSNFGFSHLSRDETSRLWFECELNSVTEVLRRVSLSPNCELPMLDSPRGSFEFDPLIRPDNSVDLAIFRKVVDSQASPGVPEPLVQNLPESEVRTSWREGLASRIFEMDELDCCRCFSDDEDAADSTGCDFSQSTTCLEVVDSNSNKLGDNASDPASHKDAKTNPLELSNGDGGADVDEDVSWRVCENHLFQKRKMDRDVCLKWQEIKT